MVSNINGVSAAQQVYSTKSAENKPRVEEENIAAKNVDEYVPHEEKEPIGLYAVDSDENGNKSVSFDSPETNAETTSCSTDAVDNEIKRLKEEQSQLQRQLRTANETTAADIERQLEQISQELAMKDNDNYRRSQAVFT